nr:unnamed protein product [Callosobruchus chinensis]
MLFDNLRLTHCYAFDFDIHDSRAFSQNLGICNLEYALTDIMPDIKLSNGDSVEELAPMEIGIVEDVEVPMEVQVCIVPRNGTVMALCTVVREIIRRRAGSREDLALCPFLGNEFDTSAPHRSPIKWAQREKWPGGPKKDGPLTQNVSRGVGDNLSLTLIIFVVLCINGIISKTTHSVPPYQLHQHSDTIQQLSRKITLNRPLFRSRNVLENLKLETEMIKSAGRQLKLRNTSSSIVMPCAEEEARIWKLSRRREGSLTLRCAFDFELDDLQAFDQNFRVRFREIQQGRPLRLMSFQSSIH